MSSSEILRSPHSNHFSIELPGGRRPIDLFIVGSLKDGPVANQRALGLFTAQQFKQTIEQAERNSKYVLCDMPTGSTPKPTWEALREMIDNRQIDLGRVIWVGHEAELPPQEKPPLGYEAQRMEILQTLGITVKEITDAKAAQGRIIEGNYVSMHPFKSGEQVTLNEAQRCAAEYDKKLNTLLDRPDVVSFGMYGVGVDGHGFGELQRSQMWPEIWKNINNTFVSLLSDYSFQMGLWPLRTNDGYVADNALGDNDQPGAQYLMGMGKNILAQINESIHIFNASSKAGAFEQTLRALGGQIKPNTGATIENLTNQGKGEEMLGDFKVLADKWVPKRKIKPTGECVDKNTCFEVMQEILRSRDKLLPKEKYFELWDLFYQYFGDQTPVSKMILERADQPDKKTTIVATADALQGTQFEYLENEN